MTTETFIKGSDNVITLTLKENGVAIAGAWTVLDIYIGLDALNIHRTIGGAGVTLSNGVLTIRPSQISESLAALPNGLHRVWIKVTDATTNTVGAYFGADDTAGGLYFNVSDPPG